MFIIICNKVCFLKFNEFRFNFFISYKNICCRSGINCSGSGISGGGWWYFI